MPHTEINPLNGRPYLAPDEADAQAGGLSQWYYELIQSAEEKDQQVNREYGSWGGKVISEQIMPIVKPLVIPVVGGLFAWHFGSGLIETLADKLVKEIKEWIG